jgi:acyl-CoA-binding protein
MMARPVRANMIIGDVEDPGAAVGRMPSLFSANFGKAAIRGRRVENRQNSGKVMADLKAKFEQAAEDVKKLSERPDNDTLLKLYALYKQGSEGDVSGAKPGFFDFVGTAKYEAWAKLKGMKTEEAMQKYTDLVKKLGG